jgi:hypothetical protein
VMSYEECDAHGTEATNGCEECRRERITEHRKRATALVYGVILKAVGSKVCGGVVCEESELGRIAAIANASVAAAEAAIEVLANEGLLDLDKDA